MTAVLDQYIFKEAREAAERKGRDEGREETFAITAEIIKLLKANVPVSEIASKLKASYFSRDFFVNRGAHNAHIK